MLYDMFMIYQAMNFLYLHATFLYLHPPKKNMQLTMFCGSTPGPQPLPAESRGTWNSSTTGVGSASSFTQA